MKQLLVGDALMSSTRKAPDKTAFVFKDQRITYGKFNERVNRLANGLLAKGFKPGDHAAILGFNSIEYYEILFALAKAGMVAVPVNFRFLREEIVFIINHSDSRLLIYEAAFREPIAGMRSEFEQIGPDDYIVFGGEGESGDTKYEDLLATASPTEPGIQVDETVMWYIGYTSGTTGRPKGAMRSHRANMLLAFSCAYEVSEETVTLLLMPIFHSNSIWFGLINVLWGATTVIYPSGGFNPKEILEIIQREKVTFSSMVPTMYSLILGVADREKYDINSLRTLLCSSAPLMTTTKEQILSFFSRASLYEGYGATETGGVTTLRPKDQWRKVRCCGQANQFVQIRILDEEGEECAPGKVGELFAVTPGMFEGYYKQPEKTAESFRGPFASVGDMAVMDEEGFCYIVDRKNDMIISGGENIYPTEIDDLLSQHPDILQVAVIGVPDEKWGEAVKAVAIRKPGSKLSEAELIAYSKQHLAGYKCPKSVEFWDALPLNAQGKILKRVIRDKFWQGKDRAI